MDLQNRLTLWKKEIKTAPTLLDQDIFEHCTPVSSFDLLSSINGKIKEILMVFPDEESDVESYLHFFHSFFQSLTTTKVFLIVRDEDDCNITSNNKICIAINDIRQSYENQINQGQLFIINNTHFNFFIWSQDPFIVAKNENLQQRLLLSPDLKNHNGKDNDYLADFFVRWYQGQFPHKTLLSKQIPLHFQGGNMIAAPPFVLIGNASIRRSHPDVEMEFKNYYLEEQPHITRTPSIHHVLSIFKEETNPKKHFIPVGGLMDFICEEYHNGKTHKIVDEILKCFQPFYHLDLFLNIVEHPTDDRPIKMMLGNPVDITGISEKDPAAFRLLKNLKNNITKIVKTIRKSETIFNHTSIQIDRIPMPMICKKIGKLYQWYPLSFNNCLTEVTSSEKNVWLPNYQFGQKTFGLTASMLRRVNSNLDKTTQDVQKQWQGLGFQVFMIDVPIQFVESLSGLHCLVKCLDRS